MKRLLCPSMMCANYGHLAAEVRALDDAGVDIFHCDIMDGSFVPNFTMGVMDVQTIRRYTDKPVDFDILKAFTPEMISVFAPMEHVRWVRDHQLAGWRQGNEYETLLVLGPKEDEKNARKALREQLRHHKLTMNTNASEEEILAHYEVLSPEDQGKDWLPFNSMLKLLRKFDGLRIYQLGKD